MAGAKLSKRADRKGAPVLSTTDLIKLDPETERRLTEAIPELTNEGIALRSINRSLQRCAKIGEPYVPTFEDRALVSIWAAVGTSPNVIAAELGVSEPLMHKYFRAELDQAEERGVARVGSRLYAKALAGDNTAMIFYLKTRGRWRDESRQPGDSPDNPLHIQMDVVRSMMDDMRGIKRAKALGKAPPPIEIIDMADDLVGSREDAP